MSGNWTESDYESGGQEFESLRARHFGTIFTPRPAVLPMQTVELHPLTAGSDYLNIL